MFWNNSCTFYNYLKRSARLSPSSRSRNRLCGRTATSIHSCLIFQKTPFIVHGNNAQESITGCIKFTKTTELWIDFWQLDDIFEPPGQNELIIWKTDSRFFFLSPHLPYVFGHVRLTRLLLRCSSATLNQFWEKKPTVLQSKIRATLAITELYATNEIMIKKHVLFLTWLVRDDNYLSW